MQSPRLKKWVASSIRFNRCPSFGQANFGQFVSNQSERFFWVSYPIAAHVVTLCAYLRLALELEILTTLLLVVFFLLDFLLAAIRSPLVLARCELI